MKVAVFGDVGGHADRLVAALHELGVDLDAGWLPDDLSLVFLGDLVHKGPDSDVVVEIVEELRAARPERVAVIFGNHEGEHLPGAPQFWPHDPLRHDTIATIRRWWNDSLGSLAVAIDTDDGQWLASHGGLAVETWEMLGSPDTAVDAARLLAAWQPHQIVRAFEPGVMLARTNPFAVRRHVAPPWTETTRELLLPWDRHVLGGGVVPFAQVHGHDTPVWWRKSGPKVPEWLDGIVEHADPATCHAYSRIGGKRFAAIDPGFTTSARWPLVPLILDGHIVR